MGWGIRIREKHKRQASRGRGTFRCHCQPHRQAAIESVPLRNPGKWKQRGSESAFISPPFSDMRSLAASSRTCQVWKIETASERKEVKWGNLKMRRVECKWRARDEERKIAVKEGKGKSRQRPGWVFAERQSEEIYTETIDHSGLSWYASEKMQSR